MKNLFTEDQKNIMAEFCNFLAYKNLNISSDEELIKAYSLFLQSNATNYYFKADDFEKKNFINQVKQINY